MASHHHSQWPTFTIYPSCSQSSGSCWFRSLGSQRGVLPPGHIASLSSNINGSRHRRESQNGRNHWLWSSGDNGAENICLALRWSICISLAIYLPNFDNEWTGEAALKSLITGVSGWSRMMVWATPLGNLPTWRADSWGQVLSRMASIRGRWMRIRWDLEPSFHMGAVVHSGNFSLRCFGKAHEIPKGSAFRSNMKHINLSETKGGR